MTVATTGQSGGSGGTSGLYDVLELVLDRGLVIDAFVRVSLVGIEILKIDIRVVVASVDTYLRFAEACNRLDLETGSKKPAGLTEIVGGDASDSGAGSKTKGALEGAAQTVSDAVGRSREEGEKSASRRPSRRREEEK